VQQEGETKKVQTRDGIQKGMKKWSPQVHEVRKASMKDLRFPYPIHCLKYLSSIKIA